MAMNGNVRATTPIEERFWKYVNKSGDCWIWTGSLEHGYGQLRLNFKKNMYAHRLSYEMHKGKIPKGLCVRHSCHNKACVNPEHLSVGTWKDNSEDSVSAGRQAKGADLPQAKLTIQEVRKIRTLLKTSMTQIAIAKEFDISMASISHIKTGYTWAHSN